MFFANGKENTNSRKLVFQVTSLHLKSEGLQAMEKSEKPIWFSTDMNVNFVVWNDAMNQKNFIYYYYFLNSYAENIPPDF